MAANTCCAASASQMAGPAVRDQAGHVSLANAIAHLNTVSAGVSVEPSDYSWGTPSVLQQQALYSQFLQLAFMCSLPQMQYAHLSGLQAGRPAVFPSFMPPFAGFMPPMAASCPAPSPSPAPCSPAAPQVSGQQGKSGAARSDAPGPKAGKNLSPSKKSSGGSKAKAPKNTAAPNQTLPAPPAGVAKVEADIELEDICRLLGDDAFLEHLQDDVLSEGSNGSSSTSDGRVLSKNNSNGCLSGSVNNNEGGYHNFASAFDMDMDELAASATVGSDPKAAPAAPSSQPPTKVSSGDLNNLVVSSSATAATSTRSTRASRSAAREAAAAGKDQAGGAAGGGSPTKITLKVAKGGVTKASGSKPSKAQQAAAVAAAATAVAAAPSMVTSPAAAPEAVAATVTAQAEECPLSAADLSRLLGEDDNRIPDGWDLDLDFENPFSCSISAF